MSAGSAVDQRFAWLSNDSLKHTPEGLVIIIILFFLQSVLELDWAKYQIVLICGGGKTSPSTSEQGKSPWPAPAFLSLW